MGSYNLTCSVSDISINEGDEIAFIPLTPVKGDKNLSHLMHVGDLYKAKSLPVFAKYDGYGRIITHSGEEINNSQAGMYVLKEVFDDLTSYCITDDDSISTENIESRTYNFVMKEIKGTEEIIAMNIDLLKKCEESLMNESLTEKDKAIFNDIIKNTKEIIKLNEKSNPFNAFLETIIDTKSFKNLYLDLLSGETPSEETKKLLKDFFVFSDNLKSVNKMFRPTIMATEYGNREAEARFNQLSRKIIKSKTY